MKKFKSYFGYIFLTITVVLFAYYVVKHPQIWHEINNLNFFIVLILLLIYLIFLGSLVLIFKYTVEYCGKAINIKNNIQLTSYSAIINFFGPAQSGPGVRAIYLKNNLHISFRKFLQGSIIYYLAFASVSFICIVVGTNFWKWLIILVPIMIVGSYFIYKWELKRNNDSLEVNKKTIQIIYKLILVTLFQILLITLIYYIELKTVNNTVNFRQAVAYTGIANFALFVSITPGAIGIREAFLLFSQRLLHMPSKTIVAASVIDRTIYIIFLGIIFIFVSGLHINDKIKQTNIK